MVVCIYQQGGGFVNEESAGRCPARGRGARPQVVVVSWTRAARCGRVFSRFGCVLRDDRSEAARRRAKSLKAVSAPPTSSEVVGSAKRTDDGATERRSTRQQVAVSDARRTLQFGDRDALAKARARPQAHNADAATPSRPSPSQVALSPSRWPLNVYRSSKRCRSPSRRRRGPTASPARAARGDGVAASATESARSRRDC